MDLTNIFHPNLYIIFEALAFTSYLIILIRAIYRRSGTHTFEIISATVFGMILEIGNTYLGHTYSYSSNFLINVFNVPLAIGCIWAIIIYCAMLLSDQYNLPWKLRPFMDAFTVLILDLAIDPIAIRLEFWSWSIPLDQEWYGVPFDNLFGWIMVVLSFSFLVRFIRTLNSKRIITKIIKIFSPVLAYLGLLFGLTVFSLISIIPYQINNWYNLLTFNYTPDYNIMYNPQVQLWKLIFLIIIVVELVNIIIWSMIKYRRNYLRHFDLLSFIILSCAYLFMITALFTSGIYAQIPILIFIGIFMLLIHLLLHFLPYIITPKNINISKDIAGKIQKQQKKVTKIIDASLR